jgi:guanyl-specific ribonuclease Sa
MPDKEIKNNVFLRNDFKGKGIFEIPIIKKENISLKDLSLIGYDKLSTNDFDKIVHFFLYDYKFEALWNNPEPRIERLSKYKAVLSPQFSLYKEMPMSLKIFNTFRNRWCGAYFQKKGIKVIPSLSWGESDTFWFCFDGIEKGSIVAVSTLGVRKEKELFMQGYNELLRKIQPSAIICYGKPFEEMKSNVIEVDYSKTNNRSKGYVIHKTYIFDDYVEEGMGGVSAPKISSVYLSDLPSNVQRAYYGYENVGWKGNFPGQANGTKAGKKYKNKPIKLPETNNDGIKVSYREYDVNDKIEGQPRDSERLIRDSNGIVYYTPNHYDTFVIIIGG